MRNNSANRFRAVNEVQITAILELGDSGGGPPDIGTMINPVSIPITWEWIDSEGSAQPGGGERGPPMVGSAGTEPIDPRMRTSDRDGKN